MTRTVNDGGAALLNHHAVDVQNWMLSVLKVTRYSTNTLTLLATIAYCVWIYRTATNAARIQGSPLKVSPRLSIFSFVIPIYCLWGPCVSLREICEVSFRDQPRRSVLPLVIPWWLSFFASRLLFNIFSGVFSPYWVSWANIVSWDIAAILIAMIITRLTAMQAQTVLKDFTPQVRGVKPSPVYATPPRWE